MNTKLTTRTIVSIIAVIAISMPLLASAAAAQTGNSKSSIFYSKQNLNAAGNQEILYKKLKDASPPIGGVLVVSLRDESGRPDSDARLQVTLIGGCV